MADLSHHLLAAHDYALINPLQVEAALWRDLPATPLVTHGLDVRTDLMPRLLSLRDISEEACINLLERARRHERTSRHPFFSALLVAEADTPSVVAHLSQRLLIDAPDGQKALFRYFDPRVFRHLKWLLSNRQMTLLMGRTTRWSWRDTVGDWQQYERVGSPSVLSGMRLDSVQWRGLQRLGLLNKTLAQVARVNRRTALDDACAKGVDALLCEAHDKWRLYDDADRCLYAVQAITIHPAIHRHPRMQERLVLTRDSAGSFVAVCSDLNDTTLRTLAAELAPPTRMLA